MESFKRIMAWFGIIFLAGMYIATLVVAITTTGQTMKWLYASIFATVVVSVILWALNMMANIFKNSADEEAKRAANMMANAMAAAKMNTRNIENEKTDREKSSTDTIKSGAAANTETDSSAGAAGSLPAEDPSAASAAQDKAAAEDSSDPSASEIPYDYAKHFTQDTAPHANIAGRINSGKE
ncbi:MAG: hypothetical protein VZR00_00510 [Lachnospiraceae bacterium]|jgi:hypothetical protein|nr:hypothetical protein [Lachnospiraceae bacterium]MEE3460357.1 hypothetical protein [Lachnospiraceae bacterium]